METPSSVKFVKVIQMGKTTHHSFQVCRTRLQQSALSKEVAKTLKLESAYIPANHFASQSEQQIKQSVFFN